MKIDAAHFEANRIAWNQRTAVHKTSSFYDLEGFKKGLNVLNATELEALGDVAGKSLLHLQCHFGLDTMSWERLGAKATGVDLSEEAILLANSIKNELQLEAEFICSNVYDIIGNESLQKRYSDDAGNWQGADIVFTSYGTIGWLPDLDLWAKGIAHYLKPGGTFFIADFHPVLWMMDESFQYIKYPYFNTITIEEENVGTYTDRNADIKTKEYSWNHPFTDIFTALINNGIRIESFNEYSYSHYPCFNDLEKKADGNWYIKNMEEKMPMMYAIKGIKM
ncbi:MAG: class I SAM-dependent methyltransferase [Ferruginibacter sp.]